MEENRITIEFVQETLEDAAASRKQSDLFKRNSDWLQARILEIGEKYRSKLICVAGEELFVGDDVHEVVARAQAAHPDDRGLFIQRIPKERYVRIYAVQG